MRRPGVFPVLVSIGICGLAVTAIATAQSPQEVIPNWPAPSSWSPSTARPSETGHAKSVAANYSPVPFFAVTPCRISDTRGNGFTGAYGPPALAHDSPRDFSLTGRCGIPTTGVTAVSLNVTVTNTQGPGYIEIFAAGTAVPVASTLNYLSGQTIANGAVVPLGFSGGVTVIAGVAGTDVIIDTNGYYGTSGAGSDNLFLGALAGNVTMTGTANTGIGNSALQNNTTGINNTAIGRAALGNNTTGSSNTAVGSGALISDNAGGNVAVGYLALLNNAGGGNIAIGPSAGNSLTSGNFNMYLGNEGVSSESQTIRIGSGPVHTRLFVAGVLNSSITGVPVLISGTGQLGVASSSARYKEAIRDMGDASDRLAKLRPVTFRYKGHAEEPAQFGLIAEEVEKVFPELVFHSDSGQPETVLYNEMPAMLLNELQKQQRRMDQQTQEIARLLDRVQMLEKRLAGGAAD
jgi:hypothetical protein